MSEAGQPFGDNDPLMDEAIALVIKHRRASISLVQRYLRIGYNRASYMMEAMEKRGLIRVNPTPTGSQYLLKEQS